MSIILHDAIHYCTAHPMAIITMALIVVFMLIWNRTILLAMVAILIMISYIAGVGANLIVISLRPPRNTGQKSTNTNSSTERKNHGKSFSSNRKTG